MKGKIGVAGTGFTGSVIAHCLAKSGYQVTIFDERNHIGGNSYTCRDDDTGVMLHKYGPHIFHTDDMEVWQFVNRFAKFMPFVNRVKAVTRGEVFPLPINLHTINQFFRQAMRPTEAQAFIESLADKSIAAPQSFEEQALRFVGRDLYDAFFRSYTEKQWGLPPHVLPASILKRLPLRFNYDDNYYNHRFQGIPQNGYTPIFESLLGGSNIELRLGEPFPVWNHGEFDHVFFTGPLDGYFGYRLGWLGYRTLDFEEIRAVGDFQGNAVVNYCEASVAFTRVVEHKHFTPWESHADTVCHREYSRACGKNDVRYYPIRLLEQQQLLVDYVALARKQQGVSFVGRLGTYRYIDMDISIREALDASSEFLHLTHSGRKIPAFFCAPL